MFCWKLTRMLGTVFEGEAPAVKECYRVGSTEPEVTSEGMFNKCEVSCDITSEFEKV